MKINTTLAGTFFLIILTNLTFAQPGCNTMNFNPFDNYFYGGADFVFYGSVTGYEDLKDRIKFRGGNTFFSESRTKIKIQVKEELKGNLEQPQVEVYVGNDCHLDRVGGNRIFMVKKSYTADLPILVSDKVSYALDKYSKQGIEEVLSKVKSDLRTDNERNLYGVIVERFGDEPSFTASDEIKEKLGYHPKNFKPMVGLTVEARRKTDGKIFRTIADNTGRFAFKNLVDDEYQVYPLLPDVYKIIGFNPDAKNQHGKVSVYVPIRNGWSNPRKVFEVETFGNLKGKIENVFPEFERSDLEIWKLVNNNGTIEYRLFDRTYLSGNLDRFKKSDSSIDFDIKDFPTGKYTLSLSGSNKTVYYPGIADKEKSEIFEVKKGEIVDVSFKIP